MADNKDEIAEKRKATNLEKYGCENVFQADKIKNKIKETNLVHFGVDCPMRDEKVKEKSKQTCLTNYGVEHYFQDATNINKSVYKKYFYDNTWFDSLPEFAVYYYFKNNGHDIKRANTKFCYEYAGELHYCFPDFEIDGKLVEIKGDHLYKKMLLPGTIENSKLKCLLANDVKIWVAKDYAFALEYLKQQHIELINYRR